MVNQHIDHLYIMCQGNKAQCGPCWKAGVGWWPSLHIQQLFWWCMGNSLKGISRYLRGGRSRWPLWGPLVKVRSWGQIWAKTEWEMADEGEEKECGRLGLEEVNISSRRTSFARPNHLWSYPRLGRTIGPAYRRLRNIVWLCVPGRKRNWILVSTCHILLSTLSLKQ